MSDGRERWTPPDPYSYSWLLGFYLGDGNISSPKPGHFQLRVTLDAIFPEIVDDCVAAIALTALESRVTVRRHRTSRAFVVACSSKRWAEFIPQHGPGRKHKRPIRLEEWQREILDRHPEPFLRGLIQSDGCRTINRFKVKLPSGRVGDYAYPRYFFSNLSADIRGLFCEYCDKLDIRWTQSNHRNISVSHRDSVARLDEFIGPKR
jgi:hypothetical protein